MKALYATFRAKPGHREIVRTLISDYATVVRAEPGNLTFDPFTRDEDDHEFVVFEQYRDDEAFAAHLSGAEGAVFNEKLREHIEGDGSVLHFMTTTMGA